MSGKRYPEEFKIEAVKQVVDRGHSVSSVATRLDITTHSLYAWVPWITWKCNSQDVNDYIWHGADRKQGHKVRCERWTDISLNENLKLM